MSYTIPQFTLSQIPDGFSPVDAPIWFAFTASFANSTGNINDSEAFVDLHIIDQNVEVGSITDTPGRFKVPPRGNTYVYNPSDVLKDYVTFPYDNKFTNEWYVNENTGFGSTAGGDINYPGVSPETEGIVRYNLHYGLQWNPNVAFQDLASVTGLPGGNTIYASIGVNYFCSVGDVISITLDSGLYQYWAGTASVLAIGDSGFDTFVTTDQIVDAAGIALILGSGGYITGHFTNVQHFYGTASYFYGYNGTSQWYEQGIPWGDRYVMKGGSQSTSFLTDYGYDQNHCLQIRPSQCERVRFFWDHYGDTPQGYTSPSGGLSWNLKTFDTNMNLLGTMSYGLGMGWSASTFPQKCFTVQVFDSINTIPIVDGYRYNFQLIHHIFGGIDHIYTMASIWYKGYNPSSKYDNFRIKFLNAQGSWNYWNFNKDSQQTIEIERTEYRRPLQYNYTLDTGNSNYSTTNLRGKAVLSSSVNNTFTLNSDWITEAEYKFLAQLVKSPEVYYFFDNGGLGVSLTELGVSLPYAYPISGNTGTNIPLIITDTSYVFKTLNRDRLFNLTITFKYAFDTNLQNQ